MERNEGNEGKLAAMRAALESARQAERAGDFSRAEFLGNQAAGLLAAALRTEKSPAKLMEAA